MINLLIVIAGLAILVISVGRRDRDPARPDDPGSTRCSAGATSRTSCRASSGAIIGALILVAGLSAPFVEVPAGNVGVVTNFGSVQPGTLEPGLHIVIPIVQRVAIIDTRVQPHQFQEIDAASAEYQTVKLTGVMNYHVDGQFANDLYQRVGTDFASKVIDPAFNDFIKTVVPRYKVDAILGARDEIRSQAKEALAANLAQYHIIVDDIYIANIAFSNEFQAAIEAKQVAQQQVQTEQQILAQRKIQADQAVAQAQGEADSNVKLAEGQAAATIALANGQATANAALGRLVVGPDPPVSVHPEADRQDPGDARSLGQRLDLRPQGPAHPDGLTGSLTLLAAVRPRSSRRNRQSQVATHRAAADSWTSRRSARRGVAVTFIERDRDRAEERRRPERVVVEAVPKAEVGRRLPRPGEPARRDRAGRSGAGTGR